MQEDYIVSEVRRIKEELAARFDFDVHAIFEDLRKLQATSVLDVVSPKKGGELAPDVEPKAQADLGKKSNL